MRHLRFAAILALTFTPLLTYMWVGKEGHLTIGVIIGCWLALFIVCLILKLATASVEKGKQLLRKKTEVVGEAAAKKPLDGFLQEVIDLVWVGDWLGMAIGMLPGLLFAIIWDAYGPFVFPDRIKMGIFGGIIIGWLIWLEKKLNLRLVLPVFPIPLKWFMVGATIFFIVWGKPE
ncbi:MAG: hypothetical protein U0289_13710 [Cyclobacteriaceae bacterium]|nr:hypothetical protein [Cyclobacteriaceae bacterium]HQQ82728.1 hypothetical protein [Cyclobacteriaceae bacterium]